MIRRPPIRRALMPIHARLEADDHERLAALADQQNSSVARIVKLAVLEFLERHARGDIGSSNRVDRAGKRG